jgi:hypothetical protein
MSKVKIRCTNCGRKYKTDHPEIVIRQCKGCGLECEFERVEEKQKPIIDKHTPVDVLCRRCCGQAHFPTGLIPKECPSCHYKVNRPLDEGIMDTILRMLTGGNDKERWFLRVQIGIDGSPWWTPESPDDPVDFGIGDSRKLSSSSYFGQRDNIRDDSVPVRTSTSIIRKRLIK